MQRQTESADRPWIPANVACRCETLDLAESFWIAVQMVAENFEESGVQLSGGKIELGFFQKLGWPHVQRSLQTGQAYCPTESCCAKQCVNLWRAEICALYKVGAQIVKAANPLVRTSLSQRRSVLCAEALKNKLRNEKRAVKLRSWSKEFAECLSYTQVTVWVFGGLSRTLTKRSSFL